MNKLSDLEKGDVFVLPRAPNHFYIVDGSMYPEVDEIRCFRVSKYMPYFLYSDEEVKKVGFLSIKEI